MSNTDPIETQALLLEPTVRDVILGEGSAGHLTNLLLQDLMRLYRVLGTLLAPDVSSIATDLYNLIVNGKQVELAGLTDVPTPFLKSKGRFLQKTADATWTELTPEQATAALESALTEEFKNAESYNVETSPLKELKEYMDRQHTGIVLPTSKDAILVPVSATSGESSLYDAPPVGGSGNKTIFSLASQLVTPYTAVTSEQRVQAALLLLQGLEQAEAPDVTEHSRFLLRRYEPDGTVEWKIQSAELAVCFCVLFVFEVYLEKEIHFADQTVNAMPPALPIVDTSVPVDDPTEYDVLFGRGGMTNSHVGNRRFRDIIALHRPDYIRAIKMDKPAVARKIVRAVRAGNPPGRFLKKGDDGKWYDVGDRTAAEKTSQGLRERSNAEKRQRSALREALRIRKDDETDEQGQAKKGKLDLGLPTALNYVGNMIKEQHAQAYKDTSVTVKTSDHLGAGDEMIEGLPPNAVDEEGNVLVTAYDILCGRGGLTNHHKGNKRFRDIVALHRPDYVRAPKIQKPSVARVIVRAIRNGDPPGRFLKKDDKTGRWYDIGDKKAAEKTSQALREKLDLKQPPPPSASALGVQVLLPAATYALSDKVSDETIAKVAAMQPEDQVAKDDVAQIETPDDMEVQV